MDKNEFIKKLFYVLSCQLGKEVEMKQKRVWKNNGASYEGLVIEKLEEELSQVVSLDNCYEDFRTGISVQEISEQILKEYRKAAGNVSLLSQQDIWSYERIKDRLYVEMVNRKWNEQYLEHKYYVPFLDLAVVYYIDTQLDYKNAPEHRGTAVTKDIFKIWSVEPEVIWKQVLENMGKESLFLMLVVTEEENSLMTFEDAFQKNQGALALLQKSILDEAKKKLEEPFYILPVSIFELMIVPESQADEVEEMKKAIIESNHEMPVEYLLSNNIYYYGEKEEVEIAG
ncbi:DUF5688 family protein [Anaerobutyricum hallii]|uniref:DUF5688 family protein n=1 Tax=Anaerobutyricum hallii TaxID=39488 RepID=UPI00266C4AA8|nr:DUF5688 family protein [Anaerobutyricum hallii]